MALKDNAVLTASQGFLFRNVVGAAKPSPDVLDTIDPERFGCQVTNIKVTGDPTSFTLLINTVATAALAHDATAAQVQEAIAAVTGIGAGNVVVEGVSADDTAGLAITFLAELQGTAVTVAEGTYVGGTAPATTITETTALNGWKQIGHTSRDDMPEFGFDGGDTSVKGTWQKKRLREVQTGDPVADSVTIHLEQWDADSIELYFGEDASDEDFVFGVSGDFIPVEASLLVIIVDGPARLGFYAAKASFKRDDSINMPVDEFSSLPVKATFLDLPGHLLYEWISKDVFRAKS